MNWEKNWLSAVGGAGLLGLVGTGIREVINWANGRSAARAVEQELQLKEQAAERAAQDQKMAQFQAMYDQMKSLFEETQAAKEAQRIEFDRRFADQDHRIEELSAKLAESQQQDASRKQVISRLTTRVKALEDVIRNLGGTVPPDDHAPVARGRRKAVA